MAKQDKSNVGAQNRSADLTATRKSNGEVTGIAKFREGPLPDPREVQAYEEIMPGAAKEIFRMFVAQGEHRRELERKQLDSEIHQAEEYMRIEGERIKGIFFSDSLGQILGGLVALAALAGAIYTSYLKLSWQIPVAFLSWPVMAVTHAFLKKGNNSKPEKKDADSD